MASHEQVKAWAQDKADGKTISSDKQAAIDRTTIQTGLKGAEVTRILGGGKA